MSTRNAIVIGSGASGVFAAQGLIDAGHRPMILDVGFSPANSKIITQNFYDIADSDLLEKLMIGENFEGLGNFMYQSHYMSPRLRAPKYKFVTQDTEKHIHWSGPSNELIHSLAAGGLANAWGAGVFRYSDDELAKTPLTYNILKPHYDRVGELIGVSGTNEDDLLKYFNIETRIQSPVRLSKLSTYIYNNYQKQKSSSNQNGLFLGRPRLAVLTKKQDDREPIQYNNTEFWDSSNDAIYSPRWTLNNLIKQNKIDYISNFLVESLELSKDSVTICGLDLKTNQPQSYRAENVVMATGTLQTASLLLKSFPQYIDQKLDLLDNFSFQVPFFAPRFFGNSIDSTAFGSADLSMIFDQSQYGIQMQAGVFNMTSIPKSEFFDKIPLDSRMTVQLIKNLIPAMGALFVFVNNSGEFKATIQYDKESNQMVISESSQRPKIMYQKLCRALFRLGLYTFPQLIQKVSFGGAIHYAGTLPMKAQPTKAHHVNEVGQLKFSDRIMIADGSWLPSMSSKHPTFTFMANAHRVGQLLGKRIINV